MQENGVGYWIQNGIKQQEVGNGALETSNKK